MHHENLLIVKRLSRVRRSLCDQLWYLPYPQRGEDVEERREELGCKSLEFLRSRPDEGDYRQQACPCG
jgi:hypothetical protein